MENTGVIIKKQEADYLAGAIPYEEVCYNWARYLPKGEKQHSVYMDSMACVSYSATSSVEIQLNKLVENMSEEAIRFFTDNGYLIDGQFNFSDRFTAKMSGTTRKGNYLQKVWDSIKHDGLLPESDWAYPREQRTPVFDWDDYYKEIPQELKDKALKVLDYLDFAYEWVFQNKTSAYTMAELDELERELKHAPLQLAAPTCNWSGSQPIEPCGKTTASHATVIYKIDSVIHDYDSYDDFTKELSLKYIMPYIMKGVVSLVNNNNMIRIVGDKRNNKQFLVGDDNELHWIFSEVVLETFHRMGAVDKNNVEWHENLDDFVLAEPIALIK